MGMVRLCWPAAVAATTATIDLAAGGWERSAVPPPYDARSCWLMRLAVRGRHTCGAGAALQVVLPADPTASRRRRGTAAAARRCSRSAARSPSLSAARGGRRGPPAARRHRVLLLGNSYLRQAFEAMACRWRERYRGCDKRRPPQFALGNHTLKRLSGVPLDRQPRLLWLRADLQAETAHVHACPHATVTRTTSPATTGQAMRRAGTRALRGRRRDAWLASRLRVLRLERQAVRLAAARAHRGTAVAGESAQGAASGTANVDVAHLAPRDGGAALGLLYASIDFVVGLENPTGLAERATCNSSDSSPVCARRAAAGRERRSRLTSTPCARL